MQIELKINNAKAGFFLEYLRAFKEDIIESIVIKDEQHDFIINDKKEVQKRIIKAEKRANFISHKEFWKDALQK